MEKTSDEMLSQIGGAVPADSQIILGTRSTVEMLEVEINQLSDKERKRFYWWCYKHVENRLPTNDKLLIAALIRAPRPTRSMRYRLDKAILRWVTFEYLHLWRKFDSEQPIDTP